MRNHGILIALVASLVLAAAVGTAFAQPGAQGRGAAEERRAEERGNATAEDDNRTDARQNGTARAEAAKARHAELRAARHAALTSFHENRTAALAEYHAAHNATRASFLENKTKVIEACRAARNESRAANETSGRDPSKCIQDGLKPLIAKARAEHQDAKEKFQERLLAARQASLDGFRGAKAHADARHARDG